MVNPNALALSLRDPGLGVLTGAISGADFGAEFGDDYGTDPFGDDGSGFGADFGAAAPASAIPKPTAQQALALWRSHHAAQAHTQRREMILEPNKGSKTKIERYTFPLSQALTIGTAVAISLSGNPTVTIRPQRVTCNAPGPMFAFLNSIQVSNVNGVVGTGVEDAYDYNANGVGQTLDMPTIEPAQRATVVGSYTGLVPTGIPLGLSTFFTVSFKGPAEMVA